MPGRDGTGARVCGAKSRSGLGNCRGVNTVGKDTGLGLGYGRCNRNFAADTTVSKTQKESLKEQKELLESKLATISKQLENL